MCDIRARIYQSWFWSCVSLNSTGFSLSLKFSNTGRLAGQALSNAAQKIQNLSQALSGLQAAVTVGVTVQTAFVSAQIWEGVERLGRSNKRPIGHMRLKMGTALQFSQIF